MKVHSNYPDLPLTAAGNKYPSQFSDYGRIVWLIITTTPNFWNLTTKILKYTIVIIIIFGNSSDLFLKSGSSFYDGDIWLWLNVDFNIWCLAKIRMQLVYSYTHPVW